MASRVPIAAQTENTNRLEAFSDGVFAIAITLLVIDLKAPQDLPAGVSLASALRHQWPDYLAFVTSFATIGIMWINHHRLFRMIGKCDHNLLVLNTLLLLGVTFVPFPTAILAEHLGEPGQHTAALVYSGTFTVIAVAFNALWRYAAHEGRLLAAEVSDAEVKAQTRQYAFGPLIYLSAFVVAWISVTASVALSLGLALFFALPPRRGASESNPA